MDAYNPRGGKQPEAKIQRDWIKMVVLRGWSVKATHGSELQYGFPDMFMTHAQHGHRWVDAKVKGRYRITAAQYDYWPELCRNGSGVWIITSASAFEYNKLFEPYNWHCYIPLGKDPERRALRAEMDEILKFYHTKKGNLK